jgi:hypothetical protein
MIKIEPKPNDAIKLTKHNKEIAEKTNMTIKYPD